MTTITSTVHPTTSPTINPTLVLLVTGSFLPPSGLGVGAGDGVTVQEFVNVHTVSWVIVITDDDTLKAVYDGSGVESSVEEIDEAEVFEDDDTNPFTNVEPYYIYEITISSSLALTTVAISEIKCLECSLLRKVW